MASFVVASRGSLTSLSSFVFLGMIIQYHLKCWEESFGGRVTGSVSGETRVLVVGNKPGFSKVQEAHSRPKVRLLSLMDLTQLGMLEAGVQWNDAPDVKIPQFSSGYSNNGKALTASKKDLQ